MDLKETTAFGGRAGDHWYLRCKAVALERYVGRTGYRRILDVGAGSGFFSRHLLARSDAVEATCVDTGYGGDSEEAVGGKRIAFKKECADLDADLVLLMDVIEHVDDDVALLSEYIRRVPSGARFLITVPAFQFLWSDHDVYLGHRRRYTRAHLLRVVEAAGLSVVRSTYYFGFVLPIATALRLGKRIARPKNALVESDLKPQAPALNALLRAICMAELPFLAVNRVGGLTVFCLCEKR